MFLARAGVRQFRNLTELQFVPGPGVCVLFGDNAQGKTNLLEAVFLLSNLQSFRTRRLQDLILYGAENSRLDATIENVRGTAQIEIEISREGKVARVDGRVPRSTATYLSEFQTVVFSPADLELARGDQESRRRFLDRATFLADPSHLVRLRKYSRVLKQRNAHLKSGSAGVEVWDEPLARWGYAVYRARHTMLETLAPTIVTLHADLAGTGEEISLTYDPPYARRGQGEDGILELLRETRERDRRLGFTGLGPHRDRVRLGLGGRRLERRGSQGQQRTAALSMKLGLLVWGREVLRESPAFLLDDPGSELDRRRLGFLGEFLSSWTGQVIITGTERDTVPLPTAVGATYYQVQDGALHSA